MFAEVRQKSEKLVLEAQRRMKEQLETSRREGSHREAQLLEKNHLLERELKVWQSRQDSPRRPPTALLTGESETIQAELGVLQQISESGASQWREERKKLLANTQDVIGQLQAELERCNDGQRAAQR